MDKVFITGASSGLGRALAQQYAAKGATLGLLGRREEALRELAASGCDRVFLGTDSAPHARHKKETSCGCAGCFNAPSALGAYATVFEEMNALQHFEAFCSLNGPRFYGLPVNEGQITLIKQDQTIAQSIALSDDTLIPFLAGETVRWSVKR